MLHVLGYRCGETYYTCRPIPRIFSLISPQLNDINKSKQRTQWTLTETCKRDIPLGGATTDGRDISCKVVGGRVHSVVALDLGDIKNSLEIGNLGYEVTPKTFEIKIGSCVAITL